MKSDNCIKLKGGTATATHHIDYTLENKHNAILTHILVTLFLSLVLSLRLSLKGRLCINLHLQRVFCLDFIYLCSHCKAAADLCQETTYNNILMSE